MSLLRTRFGLLGAASTPPAADAWISAVEATAIEGPRKHYRINEAVGTFVDRKGIGAAASAVGAVTRTGSPLVASSPGAGAIGLKGAGRIEVADLVEVETWTLGVVWVPDGVPAARIVLASSPDTGPGAWSWEVDTDGSVRVWRRHDEGGVPDYTICQTAAGLVPFTGAPVWLGYSNAPTDQRFRVWVGSTKYTKPFAQQDDDYPVGAWTIPPAGTNTIGTYIGGLAPSSGMIAEFLYWDHAIPTADMEGLAAGLLANAVWLSSGPIDFGEAEVSTLTNKTFTASVHPTIGYTTVVDTQPASDATVAANGLTLDITGASTAQAPEAFTFHVTAGAASSSVATGQIETVEAAGDATKPPTASGNQAQGRTGSATPTATGNQAEGRTGSATPTASGNQAEGRS